MNNKQFKRKLIEYGFYDNNSVDYNFIRSDKIHESQIDDDDVRNLFVQAKIALKGFEHLLDLKGK